MPDQTDGAVQLSVTDIVLEALKIIKSEILATAVIMAALLIGTAALGLDVLKALRWPLVIIFSAALVAYFFARGVPRAKKELRARAARAGRTDHPPDVRR